MCCISVCDINLSLLSFIQVCTTHLHNCPCFWSRTYINIFSLTCEQLLTYDPALRCVFVVFQSSQKGLASRYQEVSDPHSRLYMCHCLIFYWKGKESIFYISKKKMINRCNIMLQNSQTFQNHPETNVTFFTAKAA